MAARGCLKSSSISFNIQVDALPGTNPGMYLGLGCDC